MLFWSSSSPAAQSQSSSDKTAPSATCASGSDGFSEVARTAASFIRVSESLGGSNPNTELTSRASDSAAHAAA